MSKERTNQRPFGAKSESWLANEEYTLVYERQYLAMSDDEVAERLGDVRDELLRRSAAIFEEEARA